MSRRNRAVKREIIPDAKYNSPVITELISRMMRGGKKSVAQRVMYDSLALIEERAKRNPMEVFDQAIKNIMPTIEVNLGLA
jgi:small subunit ribosomal protein S7